jgi:hypothetical protein
MELLDEAAGRYDVVFCGHVGFDGFQHIRHLWDGELVGRTISIRFWRSATDEIPIDEQERIEWLYARWQELDDWVGSKRGVTPAPEAVSVET